jgi:hypothetical protein
MIKLAIHKASDFDRNVKATIQASGRLGFSEGAAKKLNLKLGGYFVLAYNEELEDDDNLYGWIELTEDNGGFKINKSGDYYNINTKPLFDKLYIDYKDRDTTIIFDIVDFENGENKIFKLIKRIKRKNTKKQI